MDSHDKKVRIKPKNKTLTTVNPEAENTFQNNTNNINNSNEPHTAQVPLLAKDSEWVDILQTSAVEMQSTSTYSGDEKVDNDDGKNIKPLALMFPGLLEKEPEMFEGMLNKLMSTTEITKHLVGHKANFHCMKKVHRLIPTDKIWLDSVAETSTSCSSLQSEVQASHADNHPDQTCVSEFCNNDFRKMLIMTAAQLYIN